MRVGKNPAIPSQFLLPAYANKTLATIKPYENDTIVLVRAKSYAIVNIVSEHLTQASIREKAVQHLVQACKDNDGGNVSMAINYLVNFKREDFDKTSLDEIRIILKRTPRILICYSSLLVS